MSAVTLISATNEQQTQLLSSSENINESNISLYNNPDHIAHLLMHSQSMPQSLPLNNRHLAKYLSKSSSRIDQEEKVNETAKKKDYKDSKIDCQ
jgi:hypothetical protein